MRFTSRYPFTPRGPKRLEIVRNWSWTEVTVSLDRVVLGRMNAQEMADGVEYALPDDSLLRVWVEHGPRGVPFLHVTRNGRPLPGSESDPAKIIRDTVLIIGVVAVLQIAIGTLLVNVGRADALSPWILGLGVALLLLALLAWRRSLVAMSLAAVLCFGEIAVVLVSQAEWSLGSVWPVVTALSLTGWLLWRGVKALHRFNSDRLPVRRPPEVS